MIGAVSDFTGLVSREAIRRAVKNIVPPATIEKNLTALEAGFTLAEENRGGRTPGGKEDNLIK
jgi:Pyruvate/2-oxoacid:ferredoxin oxidoreductase gamma subunit